MSGTAAGRNAQERLKVNDRSYFSMEGLSKAAKKNAKRKAAKQQAAQKDSPASGFVKSAQENPNAPPVVLWFRSDFRLHDNPALFEAAASGSPVIPVFIRDEVTRFLNLPHSGSLMCNMLPGVRIKVASARSSCAMVAPYIALF